MPSAELPAVPSVAGSVVALTQEHAADVLWLDQAAFVSPDDPGHQMDFFEWDRTFGVRSGDGQLVGANTAYSLKVSLPTAERGERVVQVPMAGLSWVSVHPGYRRRGVLSAMMRHHLHEVHARGAEPVAGLHASEAAIYGRFGYGLATVGYVVTLGRGATLRPLPGDGPGTGTGTPDSADDGLRLTFFTADFDQHGKVVADLYTQDCLRRPGMVDRTPALTRDMMRMTELQLQKDEPVRLLLAERDGEPVGYALLRRSMSWKDSSFDGTTRVFDLAASDRATEHRLWQAVSDFDLTTRTQVYRVPTDSPLLTWLVDARSVRPTRTDELWLRVVDVDRALSARGYAMPVDVVLSVTDEVCPWNAGSWRLVGGPDGASCERTDAAPDLSLDVRELGAALPGGSTLAAARTAGLVREHTSGAVGRLSAAMRSAVEPATTFGF
ncbi:GNAT family N-acetyltransferase [Angustibacter sp. McL0619]|uniref:GNAT family N-acetyltransferase n=1 Tax=Angustibacter sp. McL0619 TaxID=3415676 RepID=UPI003CEACB5A